MCEVFDKLEMMYEKVGYEKGHEEGREAGREEGRADAEGGGIQGNGSGSWMQYRQGQGNRDPGDPCGECENCSIWHITICVTNFKIVVTIRTAITLNCKVYVI